MKLIPKMLLSVLKEYSDSIFNIKTNISKIELCLMIELSDRFLFVEFHERILIKLRKQNYDREIHMLIKIAVQKIHLTLKYWT